MGRFRWQVQAKVWLAVALALGAAGCGKTTPPAKEATMARTSGAKAGAFRLWQQGGLRGSNLGESSLSAQELGVLRSWGANLVAMAVADIWDGEPPYTLHPERLAALDERVAAAEEAGLYVVLIVWRGPGRAVDADRYEIHHDAGAQQAYADMWRQLAQRYRDRACVIGYDLMGEPHPEDPLIWEQGMSRKAAERKQKGTLADWSLLARKITGAIREVDAETPIIVEAAHWAYPVGFDYLEPTGDPRTVYSVHFYSPKWYTHQGSPAWQEPSQPIVYPGVVPAHVEPEQYWDRAAIQRELSAVRRFQEEHHVPIFVGEFGCVRWAPNVEGYLRDELDLYRKWGWSWAYWWFRGRDEWDMERGSDRRNQTRLADTPVLRLLRERFSKNSVYLGGPDAK